MGGVRSSGLAALVVFGMCFQAEGVIHNVRIILRCALFDFYRVLYADLISLRYEEFVK